VIRRESAPPNPCKSYLAPSIAWAIVRT
jgi:hypothetical protein